MNEQQTLKIMILDFAYWLEANKHITKDADSLVDEYISFIDKQIGNMTNDDLTEPDFESEYLDNYEGQLEICPNCYREYDDIDFDYQICSHCKYDSENKTFVK